MLGFVTPYCQDILLIIPLFISLCIKTSSNKLIKYGVQPNMYTFSTRALI